MLAALDRLPLPRRAVVVMHDLDGRSVAEIAERLSITRFGTYARLRKARKELAVAVRRLSKERSAQMRRDEQSVDPELEALLERGRIIPPVPDVVRARALARARATVAAAAATVAAPTPMVASARSWPADRRGGVAGVGPRSGRRHRRPPRFDCRGIAEPPPPSRPDPVPPVPASVPDHPAPATERAPEATSIAKPQRPARPATAQESYAAELQLLQRAHAAYTRRDFSNALVLVAEHGRRFPNGRLAEQREVLRVRSLAGSGRADEARRAVAAFARSVSAQRAPAAPPGNGERVEIEEPGAQRCWA